MELFSEIPGFVKYLTAGLGALLAILGLFVDKEAPYFKFVAPVFILLIVVLGSFQATEAIKSDKENKTASQQRERLLVLLDSTSTSSLKTSSYLTDILLSQPKILKDFGISEKRAGKPLDQISTHELVEGQILEANSILTVGTFYLHSVFAPSKSLDTMGWYFGTRNWQLNLTRKLLEDTECCGA